MSLSPIIWKCHGSLDPIAQMTTISGRNKMGVVHTNPVLAFQVYTQNGVETLALFMDDFGQTELTEAFQQRCFDFIAKGLEDGLMAWFLFEGGRKTLGKNMGGLLHVPV